MVPECLPIFPPAEAHHDGREDATVLQQVATPGTPEIVNIEVSPSLVTCLGVPALGGAFHPPIDRVRLDADHGLIGVSIVRESVDGAGELLRDRCFTVLLSLRVVVPNANEPVWRVGEVVRGNASYLFAPETGLRTEPKGDLLL